MFVATLIVVTLRFMLEAKFVFQIAKIPNEASYEWNAFYKGSLIQKWWKQSIARTVWEWVPNSSSLLDIGCGSSPIISHYPNAIGIDTNKTKLEFLKEKCPSVIVKVASASDTIPLVSECFDYILCIELLEHLTEPEKTISEISRLLKTGGEAVIATPDYKRILWKIAELFTPYKKEHVTKFDRRMLEAMCKKHKLLPLKHKYIASCDLVEHFVKAKNIGDEVIFKHGIP